MVEGAARFMLVRLSYANGPNGGFFSQWASLSVVPHRRGRATLVTNAYHMFVHDMFIS